MTFVPVRQCTQPGCTALVKATDPTAPRCAAHPYPPRTYAQQRRPSTHSRGYDWDWRRLRAVFLRNHPVCEIRHYCRGEPATDVDHIVPISQGGARLDETNLQAACRRCHNWKTKQQGGATR